MKYSGNWHSVVYPKIKGNIIIEIDYLENGDIGGYAIFEYKGVFRTGESRKVQLYGNFFNDNGVHNYHLNSEILDGQTFSITIIKNSKPEIRGFYSTLNPGDTGKISISYSDEEAIEKESRNIIANLKKGQKFTYTNVWL